MMDAYEEQCHLDPRPPIRRQYAGVLTVQEVTFLQEELEKPTEARFTDIFVKERANCLVEHMPFFFRFDPETKLEIMKHSTLVNFRRGEYVFH